MHAIPNYMYVLKTPGSVIDNGGGVSSSSSPHMGIAG